MQIISKRKKHSGFSLVEMLLTMALLVGLTGVSMSVYTGFLNQNQLESVKSSVFQALSAAQTNSAAGLLDSQWGVRITSSEVTLFKGTSYATRDSTQDFIYGYSSFVGVSGPTEIVFSKLYGVPGTIGTINLSLSGKTQSIQLNAKEIISN